MRHVFALLLCFGTALPGMADARLSDLQCDDTKRMTRQLSNVLGAQKQGQGLRGPDAVIEVWIDPRTGDWTLVQSYANGTSCIVAMGDHWQDLERNPA